MFILNPSIKQYKLLLLFWPFLSFQTEKKKCRKKKFWPLERLLHHIESFGATQESGKGEMHNLAGWGFSLKGILSLYLYGVYLVSFWQWESHGAGFCEKMPEPSPMSNRAIPHSSRTDPPLAKAKCMGYTDRTHGITYLRRGKSQTQM